MATQRAATYCSVPPQDGHHRGDSWRLSRLRNARPSAQKSLLSSALPAVTPITDSPESMRNHEVGGACRLTLNGALPATESQLEQSLRRDVTHAFRNGTAGVEVIYAENHPTLRRGTSPGAYF